MRRLLRDARLAPIFFATPGFDLLQHLPRIRQYWAKMLLGRPGYSRHTMQLHRRVHHRRPLRQDDFQRWLTLFESTLDSGYRGPCSERARCLARRIAANMHAGLDAGGRQTDDGSTL